MDAGSLIEGNYSTAFANYNDFSHVLADLSDQDNVKLLDKLRETYTKRLAREPRDANRWYDRGALYLRAHYPELASSDAYKAIILAEREGDNLLCVQARLLLGQALFFAQSFAECNSYIREIHASGAAEMLPRNLRRQLRKLDILAARCEKQARQRLAAEGMDQEEIERNIGYGEIRAGLHPWLAERHQARSKQVVFEMRRAAARLSRGVVDIKPSQVPSEMVQDCYGLYAAADITAGRHIFTEPPAFVAIASLSGRHCNHCAKAIKAAETNRIDSVRRPFEKGETYCSTTCAIRFHELYGDSGADENRILRFITKEVEGNPRIETSEHRVAIERLRYRVLLNIRRQIEDGETLGMHRHPLDTSPICRLAGRNTVTHPTLFSFWGDVVLPMRLLDVMGVDLFADLRFDTDVLLAISGRINMNSWEEEEESEEAAPGGDLYSTGINPVYSLFNHSCVPNVSWQFSTTGSIVATAKRFIRTGEELFISYLNPSQLNLPQAARQEALRHWTDGTHYCTRCSEASPPPHRHHPEAREIGVGGGDDDRCAAGDTEDTDRGDADTGADDGDGMGTPPASEPAPDADWVYTPRPTRTRGAAAVFVSLPDTYTEGLYRTGMYGRDP